MKTELLVLDFESPYHIGWRTAEPVIESVTIHRALINTAYLVGALSVKDLIELKLSSALPLIQSSHENCFKMLVPTPPIPSRIPLKKFEIRYVTLRALRRLVKLAQKETLFINKIQVERSHGLVELDDDNLGFTNEVLHEESEEIHPPSRVLSKVDITMNRIDRVTGSADLYKITCYKPSTKLGVILQGDDQSVDYAKKLFMFLSQLGIGGLRSRGFGRFKITSGEVCDKELLIHTPTGSFHALLGSYILSDDVDIENSYINKKILEGIAGPTYDSYILPRLEYMGSGSIIKTRGEPKMITRKITAPRHEPLLIFNPVSLKSG